MTDQSELNSRAALCRLLAQREPTNRAFWTAEAENWSRLSNDKRDGEDSVKMNSGILTRWRAQHTGPIFGKQRVDFDRTAVAKMLWDRVTAGFRQDGWLPRFLGNVSKSRTDFLSVCA